MSNMSYCRFENTHYDLSDCYHNLDDDNLSDSEKIHREYLIALCVEIALDCGYEVGRNLVDED